MVYFLRTPDGSAVKIGTTIQLGIRLRQHAASGHPDLEVLGVQDGGPKEEKQLHRRFEASQISREWFRPTPDLMAYIEAETKLWGGEDEVTAVVITMKVRSEYKEWLLRLAKKHRNSATDMIDKALFAFAKTDDFELPPKR